MPITSDYLIFELISCSLRLTFLKTLTLLFSQTRSTQCLRDIFGFFICFMVFY